MKKHLLATTAAGAALAITSPAMAGGYVSIFGGFSMNDQKASARIGQSTSTFSNTSNSTTTVTDLVGYNNTQAVTVSSVTTHIIEWRLQATYINHFVTKSSTYSATDIDLSANDGFVVGAAWGKEVAPGLRGEIEIAYRKNDVDAKGTWLFSTNQQAILYQQKYIYWSAHVYSATASAPVSTSQVTEATGPYLQGTYTFPTKGIGTSSSTTFTASGDISAMSIMANVWLDVDLGLGDNVHPYIGAGVGYADVKLDVGSVDISDNGVAFQVGAGVSFDMPTEGHALSFEVRRFVVPKLELTYNGWDVPLDYESTDVIVKYTIQL